MKPADFEALGLQPGDTHPGVCTGQNWVSGERVESSYSPVDGTLIGRVTFADAHSYEQTIKAAQAAFIVWRNMPAPQRGEMVRQYGEVLRANKAALGQLVSYEMGKSLEEGLGEVQEMIDICDFAVGLSRQLYGLTIASERPDHRMMEQWHPLGIVGVISAFNFPVAVWSWNAMLALVCGDVVVWKPSEKTPLCAIACQHLWAEVQVKNQLPEGVVSLLCGAADMGEKLAADERVALVSATGSTRMGKQVAQKVASRLGKYLLELGGNNATIITPSANMDLVIPGAVFGAVGTCGQRCTSLRRLIVHSEVYDYIKERLVKAYTQLRIGNPLTAGVHVGPLIDVQAVDMYKAAITKAVEAGGKVLTPFGTYSPSDVTDSLCYVYPCIIEANNDWPIVQHETFAPILYLMKYETFEEALAMQNGVPQGLSSSVMTNNMREMELFLSPRGSDCGIANINMGTSGAEIGGAFGGEKETGGGRESGSDAWKTYMRRQTATINYGEKLPLAQGIQFDL